jgi:hypothetical protein
MDNGARKALIPLENKRNFLEVSGDIVERVDPVFFSERLPRYGYRIGAPSGAQFINAVNLGGPEGAKIVFFVEPKKPT